MEECRICGCKTGDMIEELEVGLRHPTLSECIRALGVALKTLPLAHSASVEDVQVVEVKPHA